MIREERGKRRGRKMGTHRAKLPFQVDFLVLDVADSLLDEVGDVLGERGRRGSGGGGGGRGLPGRVGAAYCGTQRAQSREEEREVHSPESSSLSAGMRGIGPVTLGQQFTFSRMGRPACRERGRGVIGELGKREGPAFAVL